MFKIFCLITLFTVGYSTLVIDGFRDISESVPKENIGFGLFSEFRYVIDEEGREQQVGACAKHCRKLGFFCNSFVVLAKKERIKCSILPALGSIFTQSQDNSNSVIAVYERESLPTAHELSQRFSNFPTDQQITELSSKYAIGKKIWEEMTKKVFKSCSTALKKNFPVAVSLADWLRTGDVGSSQMRLQIGFREQLFRALESWQAWPRNPQAPLQHPDLLILTFLDIFFKNLDEPQTTIYDPDKKVLIVKKAESHLFIRSFGPGDYILILYTKYGIENDPPFFQWATYGRERSGLDKETCDMFGQATKRFRRDISGAAAFPLDQPNDLNSHDSHTLSLKVVLDAVSLMESATYSWGIDSLFEMLFQDLVTATISSVIENEKTQPFRENLLGATGRPGFKSVKGDIDIITG